MPKLVSGADGVFIDGQVYAVGQDVPGSEDVLNQLRAAGAQFEGDAAASVGLVLSTPDNPIPTDGSGNSLLQQHKAAVEAKKKQNEAVAASAAEAQAAQQAAANQPAAQAASASSSSAKAAAPAA